MPRADLMRRFSLVLLLALVACPAAAFARSEEEIAIENRLIAPCCWVQTLVNHESSVASALRQEIRDRLARGERAEQIEDELARRYGEKIRAVPRGANPFGVVPILLGLAMGAMALVLYRLARPHRGRASTAPAESVPALSLEEEDRLDEELDCLED